MDGSGPDLRGGILVTLATTGDTTVAAAMFIQAWPPRGAVADLAEVVERARQVAGVSYPGGPR